MTDSSGTIAEALATLEEAQLHNYSTEAAFDAALNHLQGVDPCEAAHIAALIAAWTVCELNPSVRVTDLRHWIELSTMIVARRRAS